jgi:hypothetical protein
VIELLDIYKRYVPAKSDRNPFLIILYCDGLSCERVDGAQKASARLFQLISKKQKIKFMLCKNLFISNSAGTYIIV